jgi:hypothetical protein
MRRGIDVQLEDVEALVMPNDVVHLLQPNAAPKVDIGVYDALCIDERFTLHASIRPDDSGEGA